MVYNVFGIIYWWTDLAIVIRELAMVAAFCEDSVLIDLRWE